MRRKKALKLMLIWCLCLLLAFLVSGFLHESAHGFFAWLDGDSVSTGFRTVGNPNTAPGDSDFRLGFRLSSRPMDLLGAAAGTLLNLLIAIIATLVLVRLKNLSRGALIAGAMVIANTIWSVLKGIFIFIGAMSGVLHPEDESLIGLVLAMVSRGEDPSLLAFEDVIYMPLNDLVFSPWFWLPVVVPFGIALTCMIIGSNKIEALFAPVLGKKRLQLRMMGLIVLTIAVYIPIVLWLDRVIRINWIAY